MGYDVHITRRAPWWDESGEPITTEEWAAVVAADPELEMVQVALAFPPGEGRVLEYRNEWLAQMVTHPDLDKHPDLDAHGAWLNWQNGWIVVKHPDDTLLKKMREIAGVLGARVQGDDGEYYDE
ncbi:hypothetical protein ABTZ93_39390 [Streptomyces sp. NPDC097941]|uniref:hypothetical protein n=1 Tax=Streptomyces sp. NPDC097941 TaxID=3155685 RepID=UPI003320349F